MRVNFVSSMNFAKQLKEIRLSRDLTQQQLANKLNVHQMTVCGWERGSREPAFDMLFKLAAVLECDPNYLLGWV